MNQECLDITSTLEPRACDEKKENERKRDVKEKIEIQRKVYFFTDIEFIVSNISDNSAELCA